MKNKLESFILQYVSYILRFTWRLWVSGFCGGKEILIPNKYVYKTYLKKPHQIDQVNLFIKSNQINSNKIQPITNTKLES